MSRSQAFSQLSGCSSTVLSYGYRKMMQDWKTSGYLDAQYNIFSFANVFKFPVLAAF